MKERLQQAFNRISLYINPTALLVKGAAYYGLYRAIQWLATPFNITLATPLALAAYNAISRQNNLSNAFQSRLFQLVKQIPIVQKELDKELKPAIIDLEEDEFKHKEVGLRHLTLPKIGISEEAILEELDDVDDCVDNEHQLSGALYINPTTRPLHAKIYEKVCVRNPMHGDLWPGLQDKETQAIEMLLNLFHAPKSAWGMMTGGGTLSIMMACMAARNKFQNALWPVTSPEIIVSDRAHPAFKKACEVLGIKLVTVPTNPYTFQMDIHQLKQAITPNTIMLVASAPAFPEGIIDDIQAIAGIAKSYGILCHVDACLGGFLLPFAKAAGLELAPFDFQVDGVTSISADNHKFGLAEKGHSTVMFHDFESLGQYATFTDLESNMGMYASLGLEGSRPVRVGAWAWMLMTGEEGYTKNLKEMLAIKDEIVKGIQSIPGIHVSGKPLLPIFAIRANDPSQTDALAIASQMKDRGWIINGLPNPPGFHFCITPTHLNQPGFAQHFLKDLKAAAKFAVNNPDAKPSGSLGMYDMFAHKIPSSFKGPILDEVGREYLGIIGRAKRKFTNKI